jgi:EAL domain-containing protein (putative c-di-GMP-specific phosphodiesterase class I)
MAMQQSMRISRRTRIGLVTVVLAAAFSVAAFFAHREIALAFNRESAADLARITLARAEIATDFAARRLGEIYEVGHTDCSREGIEALNHTVFSVGPIKDILIAKGGRTCSAVNDRDTLAQNYRDPVDSVAARNPSIVLNPLTLGDKSAMAVTWTFDDGTLAMALLNTDALVYDALPRELRETGAVRLSLTNGRTVGAFEGPQWQIGGDTEKFEFRSGRYPLVARVHIPTVLLNELNMATSTAAKLAAVAASLLLAFFVARGIVPPDNASRRIRTALTRGEIVPHFQPVYDLRSGEMKGFEVLARWQRTDGSWISPTAFVPLIEANGWAEDLLEAMVRKTAQEMQDILEVAPKLRFAFNASPAQFSNPDFCNRFLRTLHKIGLDPHRVVLEITERQEISDPETARLCTDKLRGAGVAIAIDDAGTGHNGLATIRTLGAAILKIDKFFVDGIEHDPRTATLVRLLVNVAHEYGMRVVAEGVEQNDQLGALAELGVDSVQGFFLCRPLDSTGAKQEYARHQAVLLRDRVAAAGKPDEAQGEPAPMAASA